MAKPLQCDPSGICSSIAPHGLRRGGGAGGHAEAHWKSAGVVHQPLADEPLAQLNVAQFEHLELALYTELFDLFRVCS